MIRFCTLFAILLIFAVTAQAAIPPVRISVATNAISAASASVTVDILQASGAPFDPAQTITKLIPTDAGGVLSFVLTSSDLATSTYSPNSLIRVTFDQDGSGMVYSPIVLSIERMEVIYAKQGLFGTTIDPGEVNVTGDFTFHKLTIDDGTNTSVLTGATGILAHQIVMKDDDASNTITLESADIVPANYILTFPANAPVANQVLQVTGVAAEVAVLSWTTLTTSTVTSVTGTAPISVTTGTTTQAISISAATTSDAGSMSAADKTKLDGIASNANVGVAANTAITSATKTKITYDAKGLVTAGADATTADIASSLDNRYVTDAQSTAITHTNRTALDLVSGSNTGDQTLSGLGGVPTTRTVNGHPLSADVIVTATDLSLGNVTNESKTTMFTSPAFTGTVSGITAAMVGAPSGSGTSSGSNTGDQTLSGLNGVEANTAITSATKTKITYDTKGLVTVGVDATTADIAVSTDKNYVSDAQLTAITHTNRTALDLVSGSNTGDQTLSGLGGVEANTAITGATKTKITYDAKGLVTAGADATTADIAVSTDKNYVSDAESTAITHINRTALDLVSGSNTGDQTLSGLGGVGANTAITDATKTKITYDAKGLVTAGADATTADIAVSTDKNYVSDAQLTVIGNTSGSNTGDQTLSGLNGVAANTAIIGATKTKITYDAKGLVTAGADATTADISASTDKNYVSDVQLTAITHTNRTSLDLVSGSNTGDQTLSGLNGVAANTAIIGATKTKITYDAKGLVTAGADATTADIAVSTDKNYVSDAQSTAITHTNRTALDLVSGSNTGDQTLSGLNGVPTTRTVNGHALSADVTVTTTDLSLGNVTNESKTTMFTSPAFTGTVTGITAAMVGAPSGSGTSSGSNTGDQTLSGLGGVPTTRTVNGHPLSADVTVTATDLSLGNVTNESKTTMFTSPAFTGTATGITAAMVGAPSGSGTSSGSNTGDQTLSGLGGVGANTAITGATKTKITYDAKGLVTAGADATTADIAASTDKNYVSDGQLTVIGNTSGSNTGDQTLSGLNGVAANTAITGATKTKITYDAKGLVTGGADATTADIVASTDKNYVSDAQLTAITHTNRTDLDLVSGSNTGDQTLSGLNGVAANTAITGATKTKITYDAKGLVTAGADATTADIVASTDKNYVSDAQLTAITHTNRTSLDLVSGSNTGDQTLSGLNGVPTTRTVNGHPLSADVTVTATDISLGNVTNESKTTMFTSPAFTGTVTGITASMVGAPSGSGTSSGSNTGDQNAAAVSIADAGGIITATNVEGALQENRVAINLNTVKVTNATHSGDASGSSVLTLATVNITTPGTYGTSTAVPTITVNDKGLVTASSSTSIAFPVTLAGSEALTNKTYNGYTLPVVNAGDNNKVLSTNGTGSTSWSFVNTGTVTSFSAGDLSPIFTTTEATPTTTPALSFSLNTQANNAVFAGPSTGGPLAPTFRALTDADIPNTLTFDRITIPAGGLILGDATNNTTIETDGTVIYNGSATVWDDLLGPLSLGKASADNTPVFDEGKLAYKFANSTGSKDTIYYVIQMPHSWKEGSTIYPHIHWLQSAAAGVTWRIKYRWVNIGDPVPPDASSITFDLTTNFIAWTSGTIMQIQKNATGISGSGKTQSSIILFKICRDKTGDASTNDEYAFQFDIHFEKNSEGSRTEFAK